MVELLGFFLAKHFAEEAEKMKKASAEAEKRERGPGHWEIDPDFPNPRIWVKDPPGEAQNDKDDSWKGIY